MTLSMHKHRKSAPILLSSIINYKNMPLLFSLILFTISYLLCFHLIEEDAYIYFRIAENIAQGNGYTFNASGERVEAGSSPLWVAILSLLLLAKIPALIASKLMGLAFGYSTLILLEKHARLAYCNRNFIFSMYMALPFSVPFIYWCTAGLETPLYISCLLLYSYFLIKPSVYPLIITTSLMFFVRPEGAAIVAFTSLVVSLLNIVPRKLVIQTVLGGLLPYVMYIFFRLHYFNDLQISPFYAKAPTLDVTVQPLITFISGYKLFFFPLALILIPLTGLRCHTPNKTIVIYLTLIIVIATFAISNADFKLFHRFYVPLIPFFFLVASMVFTAIIKKQEDRHPKVITLVFCVSIICSAFVFEAPPFMIKKSIANPIVNAMSIYLSGDATINNTLTEILSTNTERNLSLPELPHWLNNSTVYRNYQAQTGFLILDIAPFGSTIVYDQMGQAAYFSGIDKYYIDLLGLATKDIGYHYFKDKADNSFIYQAYDRILRLLIDKKKFPEVEALESNLLLDSIFSEQPEIILINNFVVRVAPNGMTALLFKDLRLDREYDKCATFANFVWVFKRKDILLKAPKKYYYNHELETFGNRQYCFESHRSARG